MYRMIFFLVIFTLLLAPQAFASTSDRLELTGLLKSRKVVGVIYFKENNVKLSESQEAEIERIAALVVSQYPADKIMRVEGFSTKRDQRAGPLNDSFSRAKSVWHYLKKVNSFDSSNLYLTGFSANQSISELQGERVEIAVYEISFIDKMDIYSVN